VELTKATTQNAGMSCVFPRRGFTLWNQETAP
jgi:hypothetical protein